MTQARKYHFNADTGRTGRCEAEPGHCPLGKDNPHFGTPEEARRAYEATQGGSFIRSSRGFTSKLLSLGGMGLVAVTLMGCSTIYREDKQREPEPTPVASETLAAPEATATPTPTAEVQDESTTSSQELNDWLDEASRKVEKLLRESSDTPSPVTYENDGIYFQGRNLQVSAEEAAEAERILETLVVKSVQDDGGYNRAEQFGRSFKTGVAGAVEHRDVPNATFRNDTAQARVVDGNFLDPYTGENVHVIGGERADADIDHIVPLKEAYLSGAKDWSQEKRVEYANNLDNLVYTASGVNRSKSDQDAASWLPSYEPAQCIYAVRNIQVKSNYQMTVDSAEKAALQNVLDSRCP